MSQKLYSRKKMRKFVRYAIMFLSLMVASHYIPECPVSNKTAVIMAIIAAVTFAIIDMYFPVLCE